MQAIKLIKKLYKFVYFLPLLLQVVMNLGNIRAMYQVSNRSANNYGVEGYFVEKKYVDVSKIKLQKIYASKQKSLPKPINVSEKKTFIDEIQKISAKFPAPTAYDPKEFQSKSKTEIHPGTRKTIFDDIERVSKKSNFPDPTKYNKVDSEVDKSKLKGNLSKAENSNYLQSSMRGSLDRPGVGNYNSNRNGFGQDKGWRWIEAKNKSKSEAKTKLPPVGTYDPKPIEYSLFSSMASLEKGNKKSYFPRTQRFNTSKTKEIPYYNVLSEWGLQKKGSRKDILSKISKTVSHRSVYY